MPKPPDKVYVVVKDGYMQNTVRFYYTLSPARAFLTKDKQNWEYWKNITEKNKDKSDYNMKQYEQFKKEYEPPVIMEGAITWSPYAG